MTNAFEDPVDLRNETNPESLQISAFKFLRANRDMCDRLFESVVIDLKKLVSLYETYEKLDRNLFLEELKKIYNSLKSLSEKGEIRTMLDKANLVMLDNLAKDL